MPHRSSGPATEDTDEVCLDCGFVITRSKNHTHTDTEKFQYDEGNHWKVCNCGEMIEQEEHIDTNQDGKCDICDYQKETTNTKPGTDKDEENDKKDENSLVWLWILLAVIVAAGGGFTIYWFVIRKKVKYLVKGERL